MIKTEIRIATIKDAEYISSNMRKADMLEFYKTTGNSDYLESILLGLNDPKSITYCLLSNSKPMALIGCIEKQDYQVVWACGTDEIKKHAKFFISSTKELLEKHKCKWKPYVNYVDCENINAVRYLRHVGFSLLTAIPYGKLNANFYPFIMG